MMPYWGGRELCLNLLRSRHHHLRASGEYRRDGRVDPTEACLRCSLRGCQSRHFITCGEQTEFVGVGVSRNWKQPAARGRKRAKVFSSPSWQSASTSFVESNDAVDQSIIKVGLRVLVTYKGSILKATVRKRRYEKNQHEFLIHYDGNKKSTLSWIPLDRISDVLENDNLGSEPPLSNKKRKREQPSSSDGAEEEHSEAHRKKSGCSIEGCRNPIAGCPDFAKMGVCWFHGEHQSRLQDDEVVSSPPRQNLRREGRATFNEPEMVVSAQKEKRKMACSHEGCTNVAQMGGICFTHGGKKIRRKCSHEGCTNQVQSRGVCMRHGAKSNHKTCSHEGCNNVAIQGGVCIRHGAKVKTCSHKGCSNLVKKGGNCQKHGANVTYPKCSHEGCDNLSRNGGICVRHGARRNHITRAVFSVRPFAVIDDELASFSEY